MSFVRQNIAGTPDALAFADNGRSFFPKMSVKAFNLESD